MANQTEMMYEFRFYPAEFQFGEINAAFYTFLGDRLYITFDKVVTEDSLKILKDVIAKKQFGKVFVLDILDDAGNSVPMVCRLSQKSPDDLIEVKMYEIDRLFNGYCDKLIREKETIALLAQYENVYYTYDPKDGTVICYRYDVGKEIVSTQTVEEWASDIVNQVSDECRELVGKFYTELKSGTRSIEYILPNRDSKSSFYLTGTAIYSDDVHILTVGRIGEPYKSSSHEFIRRDQLTGLYLKDNITNFAKRRINELKLPTAIAIVDVDDFKDVNDHFGHSKGDEVLKRFASIVESQSDGFGKAGRIGGDEFLLIFDNFENRDQVKNVVRAIKNSVTTAFTDEKDGFHITASIGLSIFPDDIDADYDTMFKLADCLLYRAKSKGKNRYIVYDKEKHGSVENILQSGIKAASMLGSRHIEKSEAVCKITSMILEGKKYPLENMLNDILSCFDMDRIIVYNKTDREIVTQCGKRLLNSMLIKETIGYIYDELIEKSYKNGIYILDNIKRIEKVSPDAYEKLTKQGTLSLIHCAVTGLDGKEYIISYEAVTNTISWNHEDLTYFRILNMVFEKSL